jgi:hypothetical protein
MSNEQIELFGFHDMRPKIRASKLVSPERVREVKEAMSSGSVEDQIKAMRRLREGLESFDRRLTNKI